MGKKGTAVRKGSVSRDADLDALIEEAIVDAYGESEQTTGFYTMLEEHLVTPFDVEILGVAATAERIDLTDLEGTFTVGRNDLGGSNIIHNGFQQSFRRVVIPA